MASARRMLVVATLLAFSMFRFVQTHYRYPAFGHVYLLADQFFKISQQSRSKPLCLLKYLNVLYKLLSVLEAFCTDPVHVLFQAFLRRAQHTPSELMKSRLPYIQTR